MTMEIVKVNVEKKEPKTKKMCDMQRGEVCYLDDGDMYILRVNLCSPSTFLILGNDNSSNSYDLSASKHHQVRELCPGESITIKFS